MNPQLQAHLESVGRKNGQRKVSLNVDGTTFGVFDGYKQSEQGIMQVATAAWMEHVDLPVVLMATMSVDVTPSTQPPSHIEPSATNSTGWQNHTFFGTIASSPETPPLDEVYLFDEVAQDESGVKLDPTPYQDGETAVLRVDGGSILVDLSDVAGGVSVGDAVEVTASRTDLLGYRHVNK